jgi:hypothetical protein
MIFAAVKSELVTPVSNEAEIFYDFVDFLLKLANFKKALATSNAHQLNRLFLSIKFMKCVSNNSCEINKTIVINHLFFCCYVLQKSSRCFGLESRDLEEQ